ncbi:MAG: hypothetical protein IMX02_00345 [Limnochordaceae bacterium]|nr:hypothetical protein [Limnochordaceae bacterium]
MLATAILGIVLSGLVGAIIGLARLDQVLSARARAEGMVTTALSQILYGSVQRPGVVAASALVVPGGVGVSTAQLKYRVDTPGGETVYDYACEAGALTLTVTSGGVTTVRETLLSPVAGFTASLQHLSDGTPVVRIEIQVEVPTLTGTTVWSVAQEGVPRNGVW